MENVIESAVSRLGVVTVSAHMSGHSSYFEETHRFVRERGSFVEIPRPTLEPSFVNHCVAVTR